MTHQTLAFSAGPRHRPDTLAQRTRIARRRAHVIPWLYLANFRAGRILLHLVCLFRSPSPRWHWQGIRRELGWGSATTT